jgi:hypothetical protein
MDNPKIVVLHGFSPEEAMTLMRTVRSTIPAAEDAAFAMTTPTNLQWKLTELFEHVTEDHRLYLESKKGKK